MSPDLVATLEKTYPELCSYEEFYGFAVGDGWFGLLYDLLADLEAYRKGPAPELRLSQVKEKFAQLRVYVHGVPSDDGPGGEDYWKLIHDRVDRAASESLTLCEDCGVTGPGVETRGPGWFRTLCVDCETKRRVPKG